MGERPPTHTVFAEGAGFGLIIASAIVFISPNLVPIPLFIGGAAIVASMRYNNRFLFSESEEKTTSS